MLISIIYLSIYFILTNHNPNLQYHFDGCKFFVLGSIMHRLLCFVRFKFKVNKNFEVIVPFTITQKLHFSFHIMFLHIVTEITTINQDK